MKIEERREWEAICDGCGQCCVFRAEEEHLQGYACPAFNVKTRRCTRYAKRFDTELCLAVTPENTLDLHAKGILPDTCAYVKHMKDEPKVEPVEIIMKPYHSAPLRVRKQYERARKKAMRARKTLLKVLDDES